LIDLFGIHFGPRLNTTTYWFARGIVHTAILPEESSARRSLNKEMSFNYHWPLNGLGLPDGVLQKIYRETALSAFSRAYSIARG
jgi:hypothetical protein